MNRARLRRGQPAARDLADAVHAGITVRPSQANAEHARLLLSQGSIA